ncbi:MAG: deoxyribonuclease V [Nitrospirota bacterium]
MVEPVLKHPWPKNYKDAVRVQERLRSRLITEDRIGDVLLVAGADVSYDKGSEYYHAAVVVLKLPDMETVEEAHASAKAPFPYIPGLLAFREGPIVLRAFRKLKTRPDVVLIDGHGVAHPRGFGLASHMGVLLGIPAIGCAKTVLVGEFKEPAKERGSQSPLVYKNIEVGRALRTKDGIKPVFVSVGHMVSLDKACRIALECCTKYRIPEPTRRAHILVNKIRREALYLNPRPKAAPSLLTSTHSGEGRPKAVERPGRDDVIDIFNILLKHFGPQHWWPGETPFEVMVGAILTQNTNWTNVEKAIGNLKRAGALAPETIDAMPAAKLAELIKPSGYFNIKSKRLKSFISYFMEKYGGSIKKMKKREPSELREELLSVPGIGQETADSIMLYALDMPVFVVDAYTKRIFSRHGFFSPDSDYIEVQKLFMDCLPKDVKLYNEYHALIVRLAKERCAKKAGECEICILTRTEIP